MPKYFEKFSSNSFTFLPLIKSQLSNNELNSLYISFLIELKFVRLREDLCVYVLFVCGKIVVIIALYVDDLLLGFDTLEREQWFITIISARFTTTVIGLPTNILGLSVSWTSIPGQIYFNSVKIYYSNI